MRTLPPVMVHALAPFAPCFSRRVWRYALVLVVGALLAPGRRTIAAALRVLGQADDRRFERYHRVLNRATWWVPTQWVFWRSAASCWACS